MRKSILFFILFSINSFASTNYSIEIGAFKIKDNALTQVKKIENGFIVKKDDLYLICIGNFKDKKSATEYLHKIKTKYPDAYILLLNKSKKDLLKKARWYYKDGDYESAFALLDKILIKDPKNSIARVEYARVLFKLKLYSASKKEFQKVLSSNPPQIVKENIKSYIKKIDSMKKRDNFNGFVEVSFAHDNNIDCKSSKKITHYADMNLKNDTNITKSSYQNLNFFLSHQHSFDNFYLNNSIYSYNEFTKSNIRGLNFINLKSSIATKNENFITSLPLEISYSLLDSKSYMSSILFYPNITIYDREDLYRFTLLFDNYSYKSSKDKNHKRVGSSLFYAKYFRDLYIGSSLTLSKYIREKRVRYDISKLEAELSLYMDYNLAKRDKLSFGYQYSYQKYTVEDFNLGYLRVDRKNYIRTSFLHRLTNKIDLKLLYKYINNNSNVNSYYYDKRVYSLSFIYKLFR